MSRAYCLTCNEQVTVTASGTCPDGHAVSAGDDGPEPWVGRTAADTASASEPAPTADVDVTDLQELQVVGASSVNGHGPGGSNGHGAPNRHTSLDDRPAPPPSEPFERQRADSQASDDLAAMLAEALSGDDTGEAVDAEPAATEPAATEPAEPPAARAEPTGAGGATDDPQEWDDLASLAAELQLDTSLPADEARPADAAGPTDPDLPAPEHAEPAPIEPVEPTRPSDVAEEPEEVLPSPAPTAAPEVDDPPAATAEEAPAAASVDLTNFTARGARVGTAGGRKTSRRRFGRKR